MSKLVYLAGPIDGLKYKDCTDWREYAIEKLAKHDITGVSPMRAKEFLKEHPLIVDGVSDNVLATDAGIVTRDFWDVRNSGIVLANLLGATKISVGTLIEYGWASSLNKPIITVMEREGNPHEHPMVRRLSGFRVETLEDGLSVAEALFSY
jgi:nucleoside 2-deoxyribosyltransferase